MWIGRAGIMGERAGDTDKGIATLEARNGKIVACSRGERRYWQGNRENWGAPTANERFDAEFEKKVSAWAAANVDASTREDRGSTELQRNFTRK